MVRKSTHTLLEKQLKSYGILSKDQSMIKVINQLDSQKVSQKYVNKNSKDTPINLKKPTISFLSPKGMNSNASTERDKMINLEASGSSIKLKK